VIADLLPGLATPSDDEAIRVGDDVLTYRELAAAAGAVAQALAGAERVAVWATTSLETCVAIVGAIAAGVAVVPLSPKAGRRELEHIVADAAPGFLLAGDADALPSELASIERPQIGPARLLNGLASRLPPEDTALILYTSGTTGLPKGVQIPVRAIESNLDALAQIWQWAPADRLVHALPLFHVHGLVLGVLGPLRRGGRVELLPRFAAVTLAESIERGATMVFGVPTMYHRIANEAERDDELAAAFGRARLLVSGSAALPAVDHERIERLTGRAIVERYGMTETLMNIGVPAVERPRPGYVGRPIPGVEIHLVDDGGRVLEVSDDETFGEIAVRGRNLFTGYLNQDDATQEVMHAGWFHSGDLATRTPDGCYRIVGRRATDLIKSGGYRIGAGEVENALLEHPSVAEVAVIGVPDEDLGERVAAWVVTTPGTTATAAELSTHVGRLLSSHKRPRDIHFIEELPRNAMGKVMKKSLG
jgi:malonyl-CoA/methylmalonyl-CoA synthetase